MQWGQPNFPIISLSSSKISCAKFCFNIYKQKIFCYKWSQHLRFKSCVLRRSPCTSNFFYVIGPNTPFTPKELNGTCRSRALSFRTNRLQNARSTVIVLNYFEPFLHLRPLLTRVICSSRTSLSRQRFAPTAWYNNGDRRDLPQRNMRCRVPWR